MNDAKDFESRKTLKHRETLGKNQEILVKHCETHIKHHDPLVKHQCTAQRYWCSAWQKLSVLCSSISALGTEFLPILAIGGLV